MDLNGKHVVITGGSRNIGEETAAKFADQGAHVLVAARSQSDLLRVSERVEGDYLPLDLLDEASVDGFIAACLAKIGHIDIFVNNAGIESTGAFVDLDRNAIRNIARVNLEAPMLLARDVLPHLMTRPAAHFVAVSSVAGVVNFPGLSAYGTTKAGLTQLTESLRFELADTNVGFTIVAPGPVQSEMWDRVESETDYAAPALRRFRRLLSLPKVTVDQVARGIVDAVANDKRHVRGPMRYAPYHLLNNAPRRLMELALTGVDLPRNG